MKSKYTAVLLFISFLITPDASGYKILGLFPYSGKSHMAMFKSIMEGLASRGHIVHVLSHYPRETTLPNYTDLSVAGSVPLVNNKLNFEVFDLLRKYDIFNYQEIYFLHSVVYAHEDVMKSEACQRLLKSNEKYDLIITETFGTDMILGFVHKFKAPFIFVSSFFVPPETSAVIANPLNPAFIPVSVTSRFAPKMTFFERVSNTFILLSYLAVWYGFSVPANQNIMNKYFGDDVPPLLDIYKNVSLTLINTHPTIKTGLPLVPSVIEVGGVHMRPVKKLPRDIEKFIEESPDGVIYFCMGSLVRAATLPQDKKIAFLNAFSTLKERVLWKFEEEDVSFSANIMIKKWMPQRDILAHPKVKLFISHGGLLSSLEAVSEGKPILGIPLFGDQRTNIRTLQLQGVAKFVDYYTINNSTIYEALREILKPQYMKNSKELSRLFHDRPMSPLDTAIYWIEYVIRNNGAKILRSAAVDLSYHQYLLIDVFLFFFCCLIAFPFVIYYFFKIVLCQKSKFISARTKVKGQ